MHTISSILHKSPYAKAAHPVLAINGTPIEEWIKSGVSDEYGNDTTYRLVPAQGWLLDEEHFDIAWKLIEPVVDGSTVVPLLICSSDVDLNCIVVVVEQVSEGESVTWKRFGRATNHINGVITSVDWGINGQCAVFERKQFVDALNEFKRLSTEVWRVAD